MISLSESASFRQFLHLQIFLKVIFIFNSIKIIWPKQNNCFILSHLFINKYKWSWPSAGLERSGVLLQCQEGKTSAKGLEKQLLLYDFWKYSLFSQSAKSSGFLLLPGIKLKEKSQIETSFFVGKLILLLKV